MFDAMPISDLVIAKRVEADRNWKLFDAYKLNLGYDIEINENGIIAAMENDELQVIGADYSSSRRKNLKAVRVNCGLVVKLIGINLRINHCFVPVDVYFGIFSIAFQFTFPGKFTTIDDISNMHIDVFTKGSINLGNIVRECLNIR